MSSTINLPDFKQFCEQACIKLWGEPQLRTPKQLRWSGDDAYGLRTYDIEKRVWYDRGADRGGSTLELIAYSKGRPKDEKLKGRAFIDMWKALAELGVGAPAPDSKGGGGNGPPILATYPYPDENNVLLFEVVRLDTTDPDARFKQRRPDGRDGWIWNTKGVRKVLYRLPQLIAAVKAGERVLLTEGEKDTNTAVKLGCVATTMPGGVRKWRAEYDKFLRAADVIIVSDNDPQLKDKQTGELKFHPDGKPMLPGQDHAAKIAKRLSKVAARVRTIIFPQKDLSEWVDKAGGTRAQLDVLIAAAPDYAPAEQEQAAAQPQPQPSTNGIDDNAELERLARMALLDYDRARKEAGKKLGISRLSTLDLMVRGKRAELGLVVEKPTPPLYEHWNVAPADDPVDGAILLRALKEVIRRYVFMTRDQAVAAALWVMFSWLHHRMTHSPILFVSSAEKDSGKTTLLGVLNFLTHRGMPIVSASGPALFRSIAKWEPTLITDEADTAFVNNDDLREVINSGWTRGQGVPRCHPETHEPEMFSTFAPKIVAMKGRKLPDTTLSRSIIITLKPRRAANQNEHVADFDHLDNETFARLRSQVMRWAADNVEAIVKATPEIPAGFQNRRRANWKPLLAIAEAAGGEWKTAAWAAAKTIEKVADTFDASIGVQLLQAIKAMFEARINAPRNSDRIKSEDLVDELVEDLTAPWATYNKGKPISQRQVAGLLKGYDIKPRTIRLDDGTTAKGYLLEWFLDAFDRLCGSPDESAQAADPPSGSVTPSQSLFFNDLDQKLSVTSDLDVTDKKEPKPLKDNTCDAVTDSEGGPGQNAPSDAIPSTPLDYHGPVVAVPDPGLDPLGEHGEPVDEHQPKAASGLGDARDRELAEWCHRWEAEGEDPADLEDALRMTVREELASPDEAAVEAEVQIILAMVRDAE
jgi:uncharacterized protein DUF3631